MKSSSRVVFAEPSTLRRDKIDEVVDILQAEGKPLHITVIAARLSSIRGEAISRTQIEPGINRHISSVKARRIAKFGPSTFGLPQWKVNQPQETLIDVA